MAEMWDASHGLLSVAPAITVHGVCACSALTWRACFPTMQVGASACRAELTDGITSLLWIDYYVLVLATFFPCSISCAASFAWYPARCSLEAGKVLPHLRFLGGNCTCLLLWYFFTCHKLIWLLMVTTKMAQHPHLAKCLLVVSWPWDQSSPYTNLHFWLQALPTVP